MVTILVNNGVIIHRRSKMAKKEQETRLVLNKMTEGAIKGLGSNRWMYRKRWMLSGAFIVSVIWMIVSTYLYEQSVSSAIIAVAPLAIVALVFYAQATKVGNKFWEEIKDKEQPVDISKI